MKGFEPGLLAKLMPPKDGIQGMPTSAGGALSLAQYKAAIACDLEGLLNSRAGLDEGLLEQFPHCRQSLLSYGLRDFAAMSLASAEDRQAICRALERTVGQHEKRLRDPQVRLETDSRPGSGLHFTIQAVLDLQPAREPVSFDALLQPATQQYSVSGVDRSRS